MLTAFQANLRNKERLVVVWYDNVLPYNEIEAAYKQAPSSAVSESVKMKNGMMATVIADYGYLYSIKHILNLVASR